MRAAPRGPRDGRPSAIPPQRMVVGPRITGCGPIECRFTAPLVSVPVWACAPDRVRVRRAARCTSRGRSSGRCGCGSRRRSKAPGSYRAAENGCGTRKNGLHCRSSVGLLLPRCRCGLGPRTRARVHEARLAHRDRDHGLSNVRCAVDVRLDAHQARDRAVVGAAGAGEEARRSGRPSGRTDTMGGELVVA